MLSGWRLFHVVHWSDFLRTYYQKVSLHLHLWWGVITKTLKPSPFITEARENIIVTDRLKPVVHDWKGNIKTKKCVSHTWNKAWRHLRTAIIRNVHTFRISIRKLKKGTWISCITLNNSLKKNDMLKLQTHFLFLLHHIDHARAEESYRFNSQLSRWTTKLKLIIMLKSESVQRTSNTPESLSKQINSTCNRLKRQWMLNLICQSYKQCNYLLLDLLLQIYHVRRYQTTNKDSY